LRCCDAQESRERRSTCCQMQKLSARKFHRAPLRGLGAACQADSKDAARSIGISKGKRPEKRS